MQYHKALCSEDCSISSTPMTITHVIMDDGTRSTRTKYLRELQEKIQKETDNMVEWLKDNRLCVAGENER